MNGDWTDRLAKRVVLELVRSTTERRPRMTWADVRAGILRKRRTPAEVAADLRRVAAGDLMAKAEVTRDLLLQAAQMLDGKPRDWPAPAGGER